MLASGLVCIDLLNGVMSREQHQLVRPAPPPPPKRGGQRQLYAQAHLGYVFVKSCHHTGLVFTLTVPCYTLRC